MEENVIIQSNGTHLHAVIETNDKNNPVVIFIPGISGSALSERFAPLSRAFANNGFTFVRFNFSGYEGEHSVDDSTLNEELNNLQDVVFFLSGNGYREDNFGIIGKSFGAIKVIASYSDSLSCIGLLSPATYLGNKSNYSELINTAYKDIPTIQNILFTREDFSKIQCPTIIIHGDKDEVIPFTNSESILEYLGTSNKELIKIEGGDHSMKHDEFEKQIREALVNFFKDNLK